MRQRKKNQNKENLKFIKKNIPYPIQYTEELCIGNPSPMDLKQVAKSIELKKSSSKKPGSRKSRCISVKQAGWHQPLKLKHLLKQFQSLKRIDQRSLSKSPLSSKSKPKTRKSSKKITQTNSKNSSQINLTVKLQKTIKKLKKDNFFKDEQQSEIPFISTSEAYTQQERKIIELMAENDEDINIREIRMYSKNLDHQVFRKNIKYLKGNIYEAMARKIQRAWRRYRTHKLVNRYAHIFAESHFSNLSNTNLSENNSIGVSEQNLGVIISSQQLYQQQQAQQRKVTYISNLEQQEQHIQIQEQEQDDEEELKAIKLQQLNKWNQIISLISSSKNQNPTDTEKLFKKLAIKSEYNKLSLESIQNYSLDYENSMSEKYQHPMEQDRQKKTHQNHNGGSSYSSDSFKNQEDEFNSKKYIEYLDSDMYPIVEHKDSIATINKQKQQMLLQKLAEHPSRRLIHGSKILISQTMPIDAEIRSRLSHRSISDLSSEVNQLDDELNSERSKEMRMKDRRVIKRQLKKSTSQKIFKKNKYSTLIAQIGNTTNDNEQEENVNQTLQDFMRNELDEYQMDDEGMQQSYSEEKLANKLEELKRLREEDDDQYSFQEEGVSEMPILQRSSNPPLHKINIEDYDHNIDSDDDDHVEEEIGEKTQVVTDLAFDFLVKQVLSEMAKYPQTIIPKFKDFAIKKPKIKRAPTKPKKYGFTTNQSEIKTFIQEVCKYVLKEQAHVFKNLERATGPSAIQMLRYMHQSADEQIYLDEEEDDPSVMVLPNWIFDNFWSRKVPTLKYERQGIEEDKEEQRQEYLKSLNKIFLRSCFDCLNECLDFERNFGSFGKPFPWKKSHMFQHTIYLERIKESVKNAQKKLFQISATYCGIIIEKEEMVSLCGSEEYVGQVQEDRLSRMLAQDLMQGEDRWIFYDDEQTELLVECSNMIFYQLLMQCNLSVRSIGNDFNI